MDLLFWIHFGGITAMITGIAWLASRIGATLKPFYAPRPSHHRQAV